jgi:putative FmdB family regulatory protein
MVNIGICYENISSLLIKRKGTMPAYEYTCKDCKKDFTVFLTIKEFEAKPKIACPSCRGDNVEKKLTAFFTKTSKKS